MATKNILERLAFWDLTLEKIDGEWNLNGLEEDEWIDYDPTLTRPQVLMLLAGELGSFDLPKNTLEQHLDWRGYHHGDSGWAINVKLDKVWNYTQKWNHITDNFEEREVPEFIWQNHIETDWEWFKETVPSPLDPNAFTLGGRSGGWLIYAREVMTIDEAEALMEMYEKVPVLVDHLCQEIATASVAWQCSEEWGMEYETDDATQFRLYDGDKTIIRLEITYGS